MAKVRLVQPRADFLHQLAQNLRLDDRRELAAVHGEGLDLLGCLRAAVSASEDAFVALAGDEPIAVFGVAPVSLLGGIGCPWMLGADALAQHGREIVMLSRQHVACWGLRYPCLFNYVDARNLRALAWLRRTGFLVCPAEPYGINGEPFHRVERMVD